MTTIDSVTLEVADLEDARRFHEAAFGLDDRVRLQASTEPSADGFRGFTLSLLTPGPATVDGFVSRALGAGAKELKPARGSLWGYGAVVQAPDGTVWQLTTSKKRDDGAATGRIDDLVLLLGVEDVRASKRFYEERGLAVTRSFGRKYAEFDTGAVKLALYGRKALAARSGLAPEDTGPHRLRVDGDAGSFVDPDGFAWRPVADRVPALAG